MIAINQLSHKAPIITNKEYIGFGYRLLSMDKECYHMPYIQIVKVLTI